MRPFSIHKGIAAPLIHDNIDTDQIIPSCEMTSVSKTGLREGLFAGQRYTSGRVENPNFILNQEFYRNATILLSGKNFGCGSSREHAVWALKEYGFRIIIAESFGEIFYNNCVRNGILCVEMDPIIIDTLGDELTVNLIAQTVDGVRFMIPMSDKHMLLNGLDPIALTLEDEIEISAYFERDKKDRPWAY